MVIAEISSLSILNAKQNPSVMDAMRMNDQTIVLITYARSTSNEAATAALLANPANAGHPSNRVAQVLDVFTDPSDPETTFIVRHISRPFNSPPFGRVSDVTDFFMQTLEVRLAVRLAYANLLLTHETRSGTCIFAR